MDIARLSDLLIATWRVSQPGRPLPHGQGCLDEALRTAIERGAFSTEFEELSFLQSPLGTYCPELIRIIDFANMSLLISTPNPTYLAATINLSMAAAEAILEEHGIAREDAVAWGNILAESLERGGPEAE